MASFNLSMVMFIAMMVTTFQFYATTAQTRHVVGDAFGWAIPTNGVTTYTTWASQQTFTVSDTLFFNYTTGMHDVAEVSAAAYDPCTATNPISFATTGPTTLALTTPGAHYYICTFTSHCQIGQKLTINVLPSTTATPPSPPPMTPPSTTPTPPSMAPTSPPPTTMATPPSMAPASPPPTTMATPPSMMTPPSPSPTTMATPPSMAPASPPPTTMATPPSMMTPPSPSPTTMATPPSMTPPSPPPTTTATPPSMTPPMTPGEPGSGAPSLTAIVPATFLAIGLALLNY